MTYLITGASSMLGWDIQVALAGCHLAAGTVQQ